MGEKTRFLDIDYSISLLSDTDELLSFTCGVDELDKFFHEEVRLCMKYKYVSAYCVKDRTRTIIALFTLAHDAVVLTSVEDKEDFIQESSLIIGKEYLDTFERQSAFPAVNIGHLAVRKDLQNKQIGTFVVDFVVKTFIDYRVSGCQFITVDSLNNPRTNRFYERNGFIYQTCNDMSKPTRRMFLPLRIYA